MKEGVGRCRHGGRGTRANVEDNNVAMIVERCSSRNGGNGVPRGVKAHGDE